MKKIAIVTQKGGSCKTTTAALVALTLEAAGNDVLCLDCDPQGGLSALLGAPQGPGIYDALMGDEVRPVEARGLRILTADHKLDKIAFTLSPYSVRDVLKNYAADYIIMDTPPTVQGISRAAAMAADKIIIPADIARTTIGPTLYTLEALGEIDKAGRVVLIGREPRAEASGFSAELYREFKKAVKRQYVGTLPRTAAAQKAAAGLQKVPAGISEIIRGLL